MKLLAGVDIGNTKTDATLMSIDDFGRAKFLKSYSTESTGMCGTTEGVRGAVTAITFLCESLKISLHELHEIRLCMPSVSLCQNLMFGENSGNSDIYIKGFNQKIVCKASDGAKSVTDAVYAVENSGGIEEIYSRPGSQTWKVFRTLCGAYEALASLPEGAAKISGLSAVDIHENRGVALSVLIKTPMNVVEAISEQIELETGVLTNATCSKSFASALGALSSSGSSVPMYAIDLGSGSVVISEIDNRGIVKSMEIGGGTDFVSHIIKTELKIADKRISEKIYNNRFARIDSPYLLRFENGEIKFLERAFEPKDLGKNVIFNGKTSEVLDLKMPLKEVKNTRQNAKKHVFETAITNGFLRISETSAMKKNATCLVFGGAVLDLETMEIVKQTVLRLGITCQKANIRKTEDVHSAVSTGLLVSYFA